MHMNITKELILAKLSEKDDLYRPNQAKLSLPIIIRMCKKMSSELKFKPIHVASDSLIIDGHHRYISSVLSNYALDVVSDYPTPSHVNDFSWDTVDFVNADWDTPEKIRMLNEQDARYNGMKIEEIESILD